jgi:PAS domain S-box-containing protein
MSRAKKINMNPKHPSVADPATLIDTIPALVWSVDINLNLIIGNKFFYSNVEQVTGHIPVPGNSVLFRPNLSDQYIEFWEPLYARALKGESFTTEACIPAGANNRETWCEISFDPMREADVITGIACYAGNITKQKKAFMQQTLFVSIVNSSDDAIISKDLTGIITSWNPGAEKIFGYPAAEAIGSHISLIIPENQLAEETEIVEKIKAGKYVEHYETTRHCKDGSTIDVSLSVSPIADEAGNIIGASKIARDITEKKKAEKQLSDINEELRVRAKELAISNADLEQFAYVASHDLQEPLRMVTAFLSQLERKYAGNLDDKARQYIAFAIDGAQRMRRIILDLLEFSRVGLHEENREMLDFNELLAEVLILSRKTIEEKKAVITNDILPVLNVYRAPLRQVFQNLVSNALKYTAPGVAPRIHIGVTESADKWQFSVADNGIGIAKEFFQKIFIIFQRLHAREVFSGTGMGLALTKKIVESLDGSIWLDSEEGKGSCFYFTLKK